MHPRDVSSAPRTRARQAELTAAQRRELDQGQAAITRALEEVERLRATFAETAGRIAVDLGRGGNSAVARHLDVTPQHVSALAVAYKAKQAGVAEGAAA